MTPAATAPQASAAGTTTAPIDPDTGQPLATTTTTPTTTAGEPSGTALPPTTSTIPASTTTTPVAGGATDAILAVPSPRRARGTRRVVGADVDPHSSKLIDLAQIRLAKVDDRPGPLPGGSRRFHDVLDDDAGARGSAPATTPTTTPRR